MTTGARARRRRELVGQDVMFVAWSNSGEDKGGNLNQAVETWSILTVGQLFSHTSKLIDDIAHGVRHDHRRPSSKKTWVGGSGCNVCRMVMEDHHSRQIQEKTKEETSGRTTRDIIIVGFTWFWWGSLPLTSSHACSRRTSADKWVVVDLGKQN